MTNDKKLRMKSVSTEEELLLGIVKISLLRHHLNIVEKYYRDPNKGNAQTGEAILRTR